MEDEDDSLFGSDDEEEFEFWQDLEKYREEFTLALHETNRIGKGGYGTVYKSMWRTQPVAIKSIHVDSDNELEVKAFKRELTSFNLLRSPQVTALLGVCARKNPRLLILEYASKGSLDGYLNKLKKKGKSMPLGQIISVTADILCGLVAMHEREIIHRDLKPGNVLVMEEGKFLRAKLTDFGLSTFVAVQQTPLQGTFIFMAPEVHQESIYSYPADMFSFSFILYHLLFGESAFFHKPVPELCKAVVDGHRPEIPSASLPPILYAILTQCWASNPEDRPTALQALSLLQPLIAIKHELIDLSLGGLKLITPLMPGGDTNEVNQMLMLQIAQLHKATKGANHQWEGGSFNQQTNEQKVGKRMMKEKESTSTNKEAKEKRKVLNDNLFPMARLLAETFGAGREESEKASEKVVSEEEKKPWISWPLRRHKSEEH